MLRTTLLLTGTIAALLLPSFAVEEIAPQPVTDINATGDASPQNLTYATDLLYFEAVNAAGQKSLYVKKLTKSSRGGPIADPVLNKAPTKVKGFTDKKKVTKETDFYVAAPNNFTETSQLYFHVKGDGLYTSRGSAASTKRLMAWKDTDDQGNYIKPQITPFQGAVTNRSHLAGVVFTASTAKTGFEGFYSFGTPGTTKIFADVVPGPESSFPYGYVARPAGDEQDHIFFGAYDPDGTFVNGDFFQLHRFRLVNVKPGYRLDHYNVALRDTYENNVATLPLGLTLAGNSIVFSGENRDLGRDIGIVDASSNFDASNFDIYYPLNGNINPVNLGQGFGAATYFAAIDGSVGRYVLWQSFAQGSSSIVQVYDNSPAVVSPNTIRTYGTRTYFQAGGEETTQQLFRIFSRFNSTRITANDGGTLYVSEYTAATDKDGSGYIYFTARRANENFNRLWTVNTNNSSDDSLAVEVTTLDNLGTQTAPIINATKLTAAARLAGATQYSRIYFSCSGQGTAYEFTKDKKGMPTETRRGEEVWTYQKAD